MESNLPDLKTIWRENDQVFMLDQTLLPTHTEIIEIRTVEQMHEAIRSLRVRGAPAIGIAAAYGIYIAARNSPATSPDAVRTVLMDACDYLAGSRPTAVNLFWALDRARETIVTTKTVDEFTPRLMHLADQILAEDIESCREIGRFGAELLPSSGSVLTHCNAGGLATSGFGTALAPIYYAVKFNQATLHVFADETRPLLQGARLTAWELQRSGIPVTVLCDNMAGSLLRTGKVQAVIVGADRIVANGDFANKIGTYPLAVMAQRHNVPFYVAAPWSTVDTSLASGDLIPIEDRASHEVGRMGDTQLTPDNVDVYNPAFDVTPAELVTAWITDRGIQRGTFKV